MEVIMHANLTSILIHNSTFDHYFSIVTILLIILSLKDHSGWWLHIGYTTTYYWCKHSYFAGILAIFIVKDPCKPQTYCFEAFSRLLIYLSKGNHIWLVYAQ
jgi:hypothetical protein